jgi:hypothetical protein
MDIKKKIREVRNILDSKEEIFIDVKLKEIKKKYKDDLKEFKYVSDNNIFLNIKNKYIRYVGFNNKINYGGFFLKAENKNNTIFIYLINKDRKIWSIDVNKNYVFINDIITENDKMRKEFEKFLLENQN